MRVYQADTLSAVGYNTKSKFLHQYLHITFLPSFQNLLLLACNLVKTTLAQSMQLHRDVVLRGEILSASERPLNVMVSSTIVNMTEERLAVRQLLLDLGMQPWLLEDAPILPGFEGLPPEQFCVELARRCDIYILLLGPLYGSSPKPGDERSVTQVEFETAFAESRRKVLVFIRQDALEDADERQAALINMVRSYMEGFVSATPFSTSDDLVGQIRSAVKTWDRAAEVGLIDYLREMRRTHATYSDPLTGTERTYSTTVLLQLRTEMEYGLARRPWDESDPATWQRVIEDIQGLRGTGEQAKSRFWSLSFEKLRQAKRLVGHMAALQKDFGQVDRTFTEPQVGTIGMFLTRFPRLIVIGDPGAGKTTLLRRLAYDLAQQALNDYPANLLPPLTEGGREFTVPIYVKAPELAFRLTESQAHGHVVGATQQLDLLAALIKQITLAPSTEAALALSAAAHQSRLVILIDGLDEVEDTSDRDVLINAMAALGSNRLVVTTRPSGFASEIFPTWQLAEVQQLVGKRRNELVSSVYATLSRAEGIATQGMDPQVLLDQLDARDDLRVWAGNPLLLTLAAALFARDHQLPDDRASLYHNALERIRQTRRPTALQPSLDDFMENLLSDLALRMMRSGAATIRASEVGRIISARPYSRTASDFNEVLSHSGVLQQQALDRWGYIHLTFQEYLAAVHLAQLARKRREQIVKEHRLSARWEQVFQLLIDELDRIDKPDEAGHILKLLLKSDHERVHLLRGRDPTHTSLLVALRCHAGRREKYRSPLKLTIARITCRQLGVAVNRKVFGVEQAAGSETMSSIKNVASHIAERRRVAGSFFVLIATIMAALLTLWWIIVGIYALGILPLPGTLFVGSTLTVLRISVCAVGLLTMCCAYFGQYLEMQADLYEQRGEEFPDEGYFRSVDSEAGARYSIAQAESFSRDITVQGSTRRGARELTLLEDEAAYLHSSSDDSVAAAVVRAMVDLPENDHDHRPRFVAAKEVLVALGPKAIPFISRLRYLLAHGNPIVQQAAAEICYSMGSAAWTAIPELALALKSADIDTVCYAAGALGKMGVQAYPFLPMLQQVQLILVEASHPGWLERTSERVQRRQIAALYGLGVLALRSRQARRILFDAVRNPNTVARFDVLLVISQLVASSHVVLPQLCRLGQRPPLSQLVRIRRNIARGFVAITSLMLAFLIVTQIATLLASLISDVGTSAWHTLLDAVARFGSTDIVLAFAALPYWLVLGLAISGPLAIVLLLQTRKDVSDEQWRFRDEIIRATIPLIATIDALD